MDYCEKRKMPFLFFLIALLGALFLYDLNYFDYIDEALALWVFVVFVVYVAGHRGDLESKKRQRPAFVFLGVLLFYIIYSVVIKSNSFVAIMIDALSFLKGFGVFFMVYAMRWSIPESHKPFFRKLSILLTFFIVIWWVKSPVTDATVGGTLLAGSRMGTAAFLIGVLFFHCSSMTRRDFLIFIAIWGLIFLRPTSKSVAVFTIGVCLWPFLSPGGRRNKFIIGAVLLLACGLAAYFVQTDIQFFFVEGVERSFARPVLYITMVNILNSYVPFGSGFASFATATSGNFYSHIYRDFNIDMIPGLSPENMGYICDTFFPALAQFGYVGIVLFFYMYFWIYQKASVFDMSKSNMVRFRCVILVVLFFMVESVADATLLSNRGFFGMLLIALILNDISQKAEARTD
jgi:hypothetical protein